MDKTNKIKVNTQEAIIDSLKIMIPFNECEVNYKLEAEWNKYYPYTGEIDEQTERTKTICKIKQNGTITIGIHQIPNVNKFLTVTLSSKILGNKYFDGIREENIKTVHEDLMKLEVFKCDIETLKKALVHDIDICENAYLNEIEEMDRITLMLKQKAKTYDRYTYRINQTQNKGIEFNKREKATPGKPYIKIYHKEIELNTKSREFKNTFLQEYDIENLIRAEATIKNGKHIKQLNEKGIIPAFKTLEELLKVRTQIKPYIKYALKKYAEDQIIIRNKENMTRTELIIAEAIKLLLKEGNYKSEEIITILKNSYENENKTKQKIYRSRNKIQLTGILKKMQETDPKVNQILKDENLKIWFKNWMDIEL